ncbi:MAG: response regulator transcription factor [Pseudomonadales bacterium]|jgi:DNA-binding response OmpR family regulator|nr:response regulator transcription factor [Pseudomonadales bacterium]
MDDAPQNACVLLVEDHRDIAEMVYDGLENAGFQVDYASDGAAALGLAAENDYDLVVLDLMLPRLDGMEVCRRLRKEQRSDVPVLMLTARDTLEDKIAGLDAGADDYLVKPFAFAELEARVRALLRRSRGQVAQERFEVGDLVLDTGTWHVSRAGQPLSVTPIGMKLLTVLMRAAPQIVSRRQLEREVWGEGLPDSDTLRSHLYTLRKAVDRPFEHAMIETVSGAGYRIAMPESDRGA